MKYKNVALSEKFHPVLGEIALYLDNVKNNRYIFNHYLECVMQRNDVDIMLIFSGDTPQFQIFSLEAHKQVLALAPQKIDRSDLFKYGLSKISLNALDQIPTNEEYRLIRSEFLKALGFNAISERIPDILKIVETNLANWPENEEVEMIHNVMKITFDIISHLTFGNDIDNKAQQCEYLEPDNSTKRISFGECYRNVLED